MGKSQCSCHCFPFVAVSPSSRAARFVASVFTSGRSEHGIFRRLPPRVPWVGAVYHLCAARAPFAMRTSTSCRVLPSAPSNINSRRAPLT